MKSILKSKTLWFNVITIAIGLVEVITKTYPIDPQALAFIMGFGNFLLRLLSGDALTIGGKPLVKKD